MRAFITGMSGFAGSHLARHLVSQGDQVMGCSRRGQWTGHAPDDLRGLPLLRWDMSVEDGLGPDCLRRIQAFAPECVYHLAGISIPRLCGAKRPTNRAQRTNVEGTLRAAELAVSLPGRPRMLFTSSSYVYAPPKSGFRVNEQRELGQQRGYGLTKQAAEVRLGEFSRRHGLEVILARAFQHAGPGQTEQMMLAQWARQFVLGIDPVVVYNLDTYIDFTDVRDIVRAYRLLARTGRPGQVYNVGSGTRQRTGDIFDTLRRVADPRREHVELRPGAKYAVIADNSRLRRDTPWRPRVAMTRTVEDVYTDWLARSASSSSDVGAVSEHSGSQVS